MRIDNADVCNPDSIERTSKIAEVLEQQIENQISTSDGWLRDLDNQAAGSRCDGQNPEQASSKNFTFKVGVLIGISTLGAIGMSLIAPAHIDKVLAYWIGHIFGLALGCKVFFED